MNSLDVLPYECSSDLDDLTIARAASTTTMIQDAAVIESESQGIINVLTCGDFPWFKQLESKDFAKDHYETRGAR